MYVLSCNPFCLYIFFPLPKKKGRLALPATLPFTRKPIHVKKRVYSQGKQRAERPLQNKLVGSRIDLLMDISDQFIAFHKTTNFTKRKGLTRTMMSSCSGSLLDEQKSLFP